MRNTHRNDHDVAGDVLLRRITLDLAARAGPADFFHGLAVRIVLSWVLKFAPNQESPRTSDHIVEFRNVVMSPTVQRSGCWRPRFEVKEIRAQVVAFRNVDYTRWVVSICFHQGL